MIDIPTIKRLVLVILLALLLASCTLKTTYRFMDWIVAWSVDDYVDWQSLQQQQFDQDVDEFLSWHRHTQLNRYADLLSHLKKDVEQPLTNVQVGEYLAFTQLLWYDTLNNIAPRAVKLLAQLDDEQVASINAAMLKKQLERQGKYLEGDQADLDDERYERAEDIVSDLLGRLSDKQKNRIQQWNKGLENSRRAWLANQQKVTERFNKALQERAEPSFGEQIKQLMFRQEAWRSAEYKAMIQTNTVLTVQLIIDLQHSLSKQQQQHFADELDTLIDDFKTLATKT